MLATNYELDIYRSVRETTFSRTNYISFKKGFLHRHKIAGTLGTTKVKSDNGKLYAYDYHVVRLDDDVAKMVLAEKKANGDPSMSETIKRIFSKASEKIKEDAKTPYNW